MAFIGQDSPNLLVKRVGKFKITEDAIWGPKRYMDDRGNLLVDKIIDGRDLVFNGTLDLAPIGIDGLPDYDILMLQRVYSDYLAWKGEQK